VTQYVKDNSSYGIKKKLEKGLWKQPFFLEVTKSASIAG
jgi:hypothetical protein